MVVSSGDHATALVRARALTWLLTVTAACILPLVFPGDAPFINDEPKLIASAFFANQQHRAAEFGLEGTQGYRYGPLPTWAYQVFLLATRDLAAVVFVRALLLTALTTASLVWLGRTLRLWPWFFLPIMFSPYLWFYSRHLWDNSFCIPAAALAFAAYVAFLERETRFSFAVALAAFWALLLTHLMSVALIVPIVLHGAVARPKSWWRYKWLAISLSAVAVGAAHRYLSYLIQAPHMAGGHASLRAAMFPLLAPRYFSATGLNYFFGSLFESDGWLGFLGRACSWVSLLSYPLVWGGIILGATEVLHALKTSHLSTRQHAILLALSIVASQMVLNGLTGTATHPHYYNATWIAFALFAWLSADWFATRAMVMFLCAPYACALALSAVLIAATIHRNGGTREAYGPTLQNQMQVAQELANYPSGIPVRLGVLNYQLFPHALEALRLLARPTAGYRQRPTRLAVVYASSDPRDGRIRLVTE